MRKREKLLGALLPILLITTFIMYSCQKEEYDIESVDVELHEEHSTKGSLGSFTTTKSGNSSMTLYTPTFEEAIQINSKLGSIAEVNMKDSYRVLQMPTKSIVGDLTIMSLAINTGENYSYPPNAVLITLVIVFNMTDEVVTDISFVSHNSIIDTDDYDKKYRITPTIVLSSPEFNYPFWDIASISAGGLHVGQIHYLTPDVTLPSIFFTKTIFASSSNYSHTGLHDEFSVAVNPQ